MTPQPLATRHPHGAPLTSSTIGPALRELYADGGLDLPLPAAGATWARWHALAELAAEDLSLARLAEAHTDAIAILAELGAAAAPGLWGVWAAEPPAARVQAERTGAGWRLSGRKAWCSGAGLLDAALVTVHAVGMVASAAETVELRGVKGREVGGPGAYLERAGFWHGGVGVAACWYGGAVGAARTLLSAARSRPLGPHALAHLGAVDAVVTGMLAV